MSVVIVIIFKHVEFEFKDADHLEKLLEHVEETTSQIDGVKFNACMNATLNIGD